MGPAALHLAASHFFDAGAPAGHPFPADSLCSPENAHARWGHESGAFCRHGESADGLHILHFL
jgi:hypothetical protein